MNQKEGFNSIFSAGLQSAWEIRKILSECNDLSYLGMLEGWQNKLNTLRNEVDGYLKTEERNELDQLEEESTKKVFEYLSNTKKKDDNGIISKSIETKIYSEAHTLLQRRERKLRLYAIKHGLTAKTMDDPNASVFR